MIYHAFERVMSSKRMKRYLNACGGNKRKAQTLYRLNLRLSQEMFTVISCYEVALRNAIDNIMSDSFGQDWLRDAIKPGGIFDNTLFAGTTRIMHKAYNELVSKGKYSCSKKLSAMEFGLSTNAAFNLFARTVVREQAIPFPISLNGSESEKRSRVAQKALDRVQSLSAQEAHEWTDEEIDELIAAHRRKKRER